MPWQPLDVGVVQASTASFVEWRSASTKRRASMYFLPSGPASSLAYRAVVLEIRYTNEFDTKPLRCTVAIL